jgi:hypothetical protein
MEQLKLQGVDSGHLKKRLFEKDLFNHTFDIFCFIFKYTIYSI